MISSWLKAKLYLFLISLNDVAGLPAADLVLFGPNKGFVTGKQTILICQVVADKVTATSSKCVFNIKWIQLVKNSSTVLLAHAGFPDCNKTWNNDNGRCVSGTGGAGGYVYEFKYTPKQEDFNKFDVYLSCKADCAPIPINTPYPFSMLSIRPIHPDNPPPTTNKPHPLPSNDSNETTPNPEEEIGMCGEAYAGLVACVILGLFNAGVVAAILKLPKTGPAAQPAGMTGELAPAASAPNAASASAASAQGKASAADVSPPSEGSPTATATTSATAATDQEDQTNAEEETEKDEV